VRREDEDEMKTTTSICVFSNERRHRVIGSDLVIEVDHQLAETVTLRRHGKTMHLHLPWLLSTLHKLDAITKVKP
jgi:hypothetical protein